LRLAVLADIHGNAIALDAVLEDVASLGGVEAYWILGDLVAIGPDPVGVLQRLHALPDAEFTRGNTDRYVTTGIRPSPAVEGSAVDEGVARRLVEIEGTFSFAHGAVAGYGAFGWLAALPIDVRLVAGDGTRMLGVHASPGRDDGYGLHPDQAIEHVRKLFGRADADLVFVGHTHKVVDRVVDGVRLVNPGSVSNHVGPDVTAKWVLLETHASGYELTFRSVPYDNEAVVAALENVRHPGAAFIAHFMRGEAPSTLPEA
jgi:predicted phosphodiesterase